MSLYEISLTAGLARQNISRHHSTDLLALFWCLIAVVFVYAYIGTLVSFLSVPKLKPIIFSLEDLPNSRLTYWVVRRGTDLDTLFMVND